MKKITVITGFAIHAAGLSIANTLTANDNLVVLASSRDTEQLPPEFDDVKYLKSFKDTPEYDVSLFEKPKSKYHK